MTTERNAIMQSLTHFTPQVSEIERRGKFRLEFSSSRLSFSKLDRLDSIPNKTILLNSLYKNRILLFLYFNFFIIFLFTALFSFIYVRMRHVGSDIFAC